MDKYEKALEQARNYYPDNLFLDTIFPELQEGEDEKIRKVLFKMAKVPRKEIYEAEGITKEQALAYLEKQKEQKGSLRVIKDASEWENIKEQKPAEWSEEDKEMLDFAIRAIGLCRQYAINNQVNGYSKLPDVPKRYEELQDWLNSLPERFNLQPKKEWSVEDEKRYNAALDAYYYKDCNEKEDVVLALKDLCDLIGEKRKVIPPYQRWKPSEEQIAALADATMRDVFPKGNRERLESLYNDLKKF